MRGEPVVIDGTYLTVPLTEEAQRAVERVLYERVAALDVALEPFGLHAGDIALPTFKRIVRADEFATTPDDESRSRDA